MKGRYGPLSFLQISLNAINTLIIDNDVHNFSLFLHTNSNYGKRIGKKKKKKKYAVLLA